jgi:DNA polymerase III delta prime subunit
VVGKNKIIVMDDIDTMNEQSQQVFRNCIDKYGKNVFFLATCSNIQKVIESIQSRLQIIKLPPYSREHLRAIMEKIAATEDIKLDVATHEFLLNISNYSVRIMINYLEKIHLVLPVCVPRPPATYDLCNKLCTDISFETFEKYTQHLRAGELAAAVRILYEIYDYGYSVIDIFDDYFLFIKTADTAVLSEDERYKIIPYLCKYITAFHNIHEDPIELALFSNNLLCGVFGAQK